jgi:hypothetical protein
MRYKKTLIDERQIVEHDNFVFIVDDCKEEFNSLNDFLAVNPETVGV